MPDCRANSAAGADRITDPPTDPRRVRVMLPLPLPEPLDYLMPDGAAAPEPGSFVRVTLGPRRLVGVVWEMSGEESPPSVPAERLKPVGEILSTPPLRPELRRFVERVAGYTLSPPGAVLRMAMSVEEALLPPPPRRLCAATPAGLAALDQLDPAKPLTAARRRVLETLRDGAAYSVAEAARRAGCGAAVVRGLMAAGQVGERLVSGEVPAPPLPPGAWDAPGPMLSPDQRAAASRLVARTSAGEFSVTVLDGVTGSGKTETYFAAIAIALAAGHQVLVLLPEIALGAQWLDRFRRRFGVAPVEWHSDVSHTARRDAWRAVASGRARIVVGARSALFLPFPELGLIVVDEEHDPSFKQDDGVCYQARDMAVLRASLAQIPIVLVSATPSLETVVNISRGRYQRVHLPRRHAEASLPEIALVDMRRERLAPGHFLSARLVEALGQTLSVGEQALLFLNRRGYAPLTLCRACGHRLSCPSCTAWLVEHRFTGRLQCHHCGHAERLPALCPECLTAGTLVPCGPGVERVREEVAARFPGARIALMVSDLLSGPRAAAELADAMVAHRYDVLIGTQIVAKGHHFPMLTLVGVVDADLGLAGGDLRAAERTYQLLHQVAGRAGREERPGHVLIQTYMPEQPVMQALAKGDRDGFLAAEADARRAAGLPPFGRLAALIVSAGDADSADFAARALSRAAPQLPGVSVLGPAPAPLAILRRRHRRRFLVKAERSVNLQAMLRDWLGRVRLGGSARLQVDIEPYSFI
ncbi:MAG TPA: primosomal protein N' [Stellaceae bacterium]|jgi:primosomal protein N' (replication factor Y)|nr:primosomal protein N' [Stellaceae bacterium]